MEEGLEAGTGLGLVGVAGVVLTAVGEHQLHIVDVFRRCFVFTVVDLLPDGTQGNWILDDVIVVGYLCLRDQLHEGPAVLMSDQFRYQLLACCDLSDPSIPPGTTAIGRGRRGQQDGFGFSSDLCQGSFLSWRGVPRWWRQDLVAEPGADAAAWPRRFAIGHGCGLLARRALRSRSSLGG